MSDYLNIDSSMDDRIGFGNYADCTWQEVLENDPSYIEWVMEECMTVSEEVSEMLTDALEEL